MEENKGIGQDGVRQDVVPAVPELLKYPPGLCAATRLSGGQHGGVALAAGCRHQAKDFGPEPVTMQQMPEPLKFTVAGEGIRLTQDHSPGKEPGQCDPDPGHPGKFGLLNKEPCFTA